MSESTSGTSRTRRFAGSGQKKRAATGLAALLVCYGWPFVSNATTAAPFQEYVHVFCPTGQNFCEVYFTPPPTDKRLELNNVSCYVRGKGDLDISDMFLLINHAKNRSFHLVYLAPEEVAKTGETVEFAANHSLFAYVKNGEFVRIIAVGRADTFRRLACHASGRLV